MHGLPAGSTGTWVGTWVARGWERGWDRFTGAALTPANQAGAHD